MKSDEAALYHDIPSDLTIPELYRLLNARRIEMDEHIASLACTDPGLENNWQVLDSILMELRRLVQNLAQSAADNIAALREKADVLWTLFRHEEADGGPAIPDEERSALAVSLVRDVLRLPET